MKTSQSPGFDWAGAPAARIVVAALAAWLPPHSVQAQNAVNNFNGVSNGSLLTASKWSLGVLPGVTADAVLTGGTGIRTITAANLTVGSLNVTATTGTFSIQNQTTKATHSNLILGGAGNLGNGVSGTVEDLLFVALGSTMLIRGDNTSGAGVLDLVLGQSGNFDIAGTATISSIISDGGSHYGFTRTGVGKLTLSGVNSYDGNTTVIGGTLELADNAGVKFHVSDESSNSITGTGTLMLLGDFMIDTTAVTVGAGPWALVDVAHLHATFAPTFSVAGTGWSEIANVWIKTDGASTWTFTEATGVLAVNRAAVSGYDAWATTTCGLSAASAGFDVDNDHDGIANGLEWVLGGDPTRNDTAAIQPVVTGGVSEGLTMVFARAVTNPSEAELEVEWGAEPGALTHRLVVAATGPNGDAPTVEIDAPTVGRVTVHIPAANASGGRLFARLRATRN